MKRPLTQRERKLIRTIERLLAALEKEGHPGETPSWAGQCVQCEVVDAAKKQIEGMR